MLVFPQCVHGPSSMRQRTPALTPFPSSPVKPGRVLLLISYPIARLPIAAPRRDQKHAPQLPAITVFPRNDSQVGEIDRDQQEVDEHRSKSRAFSIVPLDGAGPSIILGR